MPAMADDDPQQDAFEAAKDKPVLPPVPEKRYFTISEASQLCNVKAHVLRYWESEFQQLSPVKRAGNRRYYQRQDILLIRQINTLLHQEGYTISGARQKLSGEDAQQDMTQSGQVVREVRMELEKLLKTLNQPH
jgi:DNA-binding transcriptional MerR regulator